MEESSIKIIKQTINQLHENPNIGSENQAVNDQPFDESVTNSLVNNIMVDLPKKKPFYRCDDCELSFTSHAVLESHLQGARHAKQIRTKNLIATLDESKAPFLKDAETNGLQCNVCNVRLNSLQQLQAHLNGNRHKKKALKGGWGTIESESNIGSDRSSSLKTVITGKLSLGKVICKVCNETFDSQTLYRKHSSEKVHIDKLKMKKKERPKQSPNRMKKGKKGDNDITSNIKKPLENFFVSSGYYYNGVTCQENLDIS